MASSELREQEIAVYEFAFVLKSTNKKRRNGIVGTRNSHQPDDESEGKKRLETKKS